MIELLIVAVVVLTFVISYYLWDFRRTRESIRHLKGPPFLPLLGNGLLLVWKKPSEVLKVFESFTQLYGSTWRIMVGRNLLVSISGPKEVEAVLASQKLIDKADEYEYMTDWLGTGLLIATGSKWFKRRKVITPTFHFKILEQFTEVFDKHSATFVQNLAKFKGQEFDVFPHIALCALDIISGKKALI